MKTSRFIPLRILFNSLSSRGRVALLLGILFPLSGSSYSQLGRIEGGTFQMGDQFGEGYGNEQPIHSVTIRDFELGRTEVAFAEYNRFCEATNREKPDDEG